MMRRFFLPLLFLLCGVAVLRAERDLYNPLAVGLRWDVDVEMTALGGQVIKGTAVREITGTDKIEGYTYFIVTTSFTGLEKMKDFTMYRRKAANGIYVISGLDKTKQEHLEVALPLTVGATWKTVVFGQVITSTVDAKEPLKIGEKTYEDCMKISYKSADGKLSGTYWEAPDIGNVQEETKANGLTFKFTLSKYSGLK
jgi:hypothetical protein